MRKLSAVEITVEAFRATFEAQAETIWELEENLKRTQSEMWEARKDELGVRLKQSEKSTKLIKVDAKFESWVHDGETYLIEIYPTGQHHFHIYDRDTLGWIPLVDPKMIVALDEATTNNNDVI